jgi:hypothetical protein
MKSGLEKGKVMYVSELKAWLAQHDDNEIVAVTNEGSSVQLGVTVNEPEVLFAYETLDMDYWWGGNTDEEKRIRELERTVEELRKEIAEHEKWIKTLEADL